MASSSDYENQIAQLLASSPVFSTSDTTNSYQGQATAAENAVNNVGAFQQSDAATALQSKLTEIQNNAPGDYESKYQSTIDGLMNKILNRESFSYDFNADPIYQQYKDQYTKLGNEASMNAAANASALTGGYGSSYATTAAAQANQQYLTQLNNIIPDLAEAAYTKYQDETSNLYNQFNMLGDQEDREYSQYRDTVSDYQTNRDYYTNAYSDQWNRDQSEYTTNISRLQADRDYYQQAYSDSYNRDQSQYENSYNVWNTQLGTATDMYGNALSSEEWAAEMAYQKERDAVSDSQWAAEYALSQANANKSSSSKSATTSDDSKQTIATLNTETKNKLLSSVLSSVGYNGDAYKSASAVNSAIYDMYNSGQISYGDAKELVSTYKYYASL